MLDMQISFKIDDVKVEYVSELNSFVINYLISEGEIYNLQFL